MAVYDSIVITGAGGMLAHALSDALRARGLGPALVGRAQCDIADPEAVKRLFAQYRPTLLINCAAHTGVDLCEEEPQKANAINGDGVGYLSTAAREHRTKLIHFSTDFVFDGHNDRPYRPDDRPDPLSAYGSSKLLGEQWVVKADPTGWMIIRTSWLFGRYGDCFPKTIVKLAESQRRLRVVQDQIGSPTSTVDLADATLKLVDANGAGTFHVTNSGQTSWYGFATAVLSEFGLTADLAPVSTEEWLDIRPKQAKRPSYSVLDTSRYSAVTGHRLRDWRDALHEYREMVRNDAASK
jgi:dTDP-4-dehydrorhamnose reductase